MKSGKHPDKKLTAVTVRNAGPGRYADGNGLYLRVKDSGSRHWVLRTRIHGKRCDIGLGGITLVTLAEARERALTLRKIARAGGDPLAELRKSRQFTLTFAEAAFKTHAMQSESFKNIKHVAQWIWTLETYAYPFIGRKSVDHIESSDVLKVLAPIWLEIPETARRVRQRMKAVFEWAIAAGCRTANNPVDGIARVLPKHRDTKKHHPALNYKAVPGFIADLHKSNAGLSVLAGFEFLILTASRTSEVLLAKWSEVDLITKTWTIPAERMKAHKEHRVPLSPRCMQLLAEANKLQDGSGYVFPGRPGKPLSNTVFLMCMRHMGRDGLTGHGFRSSFRDWAAEATNFPREVCEAALAHTLQNKTEAAYNRTDLFEKRRALMETWAAFVTSSGKVISIRA